MSDIKIITFFYSNIILSYFLKYFNAMNFTYLWLLEDIAFYVWNPDSQIKIFINVIFILHFKHFFLPDWF